MMGVYIIDGLLPAPRVLKKRQPQKKEQTHGNEFIASGIGVGYKQKYCSFCAFFGCQDPLVAPPNKLEFLNIKCDEFFQWIRFMMKEAQILSKDFSVDKQTCMIQGKYVYKIRCGKYKRIGDGIQPDCVADDSFTYNFYFCNEPWDKKWLDKGMLPMHAQILHMYSSL